MKKTFKELLFCKDFIEKSYIKVLNNAKLLPQLPYFDELIITKKSTTFKTYIRNYEVENIDSTKFINSADQHN